MNIRDYFGQKDNACQAIYYRDKNENFDQQVKDTAENQLKKDSFHRYYSANLTAESKRKL